MKRNLLISILMTLCTTVILGVVYPLLITGIAQVAFHDNANGRIITRDGQAIGSRIIGQPFTGDAYFHGRPSATAYDGASSGGSNLAPTNSKLIQLVEERVRHEQVGNKPVPVELVTASASGLDPNLSPGATLYQVPRVAKARGASQRQLIGLIASHTKSRDLGFLGEPRVNVLELNLDLDRLYPVAKQGTNLN